METSADWSETPPGQVGKPLVDSTEAEEEDAMLAEVSSTGLSDFVGEIQLHALDNAVLEAELLNSGDTEVAPVLVPVKSGALPTDLPSGFAPLDHRVLVPKVEHSSDAVEMTSNDLKSKSTELPMTSNDLNTSTSTTTTTTTTADMTVPQVIVTYNKPTVLVHSKPANMPSLTPHVLIGNVSDYAISIPTVSKWKYIPNPSGTLRAPFHGLEHQVRYRLTPETRAELQMSAHRLWFCISQLFSK